VSVIVVGIMTTAQARGLASIAREYGRELIDITTRQAIQFHWLRVENLPDIFKRLEEVGLYSYEACGDCLRTIVGNPLAGIDKDELFDMRAIVDEINEFFLLNRDFSNLPRKYKMSISSSIYNNANAEINDLAFTPAEKVIDGQEMLGFHAHVGGGLSAKPFLAKELDMFVRPEEVLKVAIGVTTIFRDYGYREKLQAPVLQRLTPYPKNFMSRTVSCTGNEFCSLAIVETKERARRLAEYLDENVSWTKKSAFT
jgi:ferredoxin-nitrite reductase